jgi:hypothetical protein
MRRVFKQGEVLFRQGDASDCVLRIDRGKIEVLRELGTITVLLGHVHQGEWLGEMGAIENRSRSATARATTDGVAEVLTAREFLHWVSRDPTLAGDLILRLSIRLRTIEDKIVGNLLAFSEEDQTDAVEVVGATAAPAEGTVSLTAHTDALREQIGSAAIPVGSLPFVVGRIPLADEAEPSSRPDLLIADAPPFRLSRQHFAIARSGNALFISDLRSTLGTIVNCQAIGHHFMRDTAPLHRGENHVLAGGWDSPFQFVVSIG